MDIFTTGYYKPNRILLTAMGLWPYFPNYLNLLIRITSALILYSLYVPQYAYFKYHEYTTSDIVAAMIVAISVFSISIKVWFVAYNMEQIRLGIKRIEEDWSFFNGTPIIEVFHRFAERGNLGTKFYAAMMFPAAPSFFLLPLQPVIADFLLPLNQSRSKIYAVYTDYSIYGIGGGDDYYYLTICHGFFMGIIMGNMMVSIDTFVVISVEHCCGLFEAVGFTLKALGRESHQETQNRIICDAIHIHKRAISLANLIESAFTMMYGVLVLTNTTLLSITALQTVFMRDKPSEVIRYVLMLIGDTVHLLFLSLPGQELYDHSSRIFKTIYECNWFDIPVKEQKLILLLLVRSMRPSYMTAGKFYLLNVENFKNIFQASISYFTVFLSIQ